MSTVLRIKTEKVRGVSKFVIDLRNFGQGREYYSTMSAARARLIDVQNNGLEAANLSPKDRFALIEAMKVLAPLNATLAQAVEFYATHHAARKEKSLADAAKEFVDEKIRTRKRLRYVRQLAYDLAPLVDKHGAQPCHSITRENIEAFLAAGKWQPRTVNGKLITLQTFFSFALSRGWVFKSPCVDIGRVSVDPERPGILSVGGAERLMQAAHAEEARFVPYLALALFAGVRPQEIHRLTWKDVDLPAGIVRIQAAASKTRQQRIVHLTDNCKAWLALGGDLPPVGWLDALNNVRRIAGYEYSIRKRRKGEKTVMQKGEKWPHDCLRHSFVSYSLPIHGIAHTAREAGHSENILHAHYKELVTRADAEKFWRIMPSQLSSIP